MDAAVPPAKIKAKRGLGGILMFMLCFVAGTAAGGAGAAIGLMMFAPQRLAAGATPLPEAKPAVKSPVEYVEIDNAFTSNLVDTGRYLQVKIAVSTEGGPAVAAAIVRHKPAIVSAVLAVLGELGESDVASRAAKDRMRARIRAAMNDVLIRKAATAGIAEVFIVSMVVQ